MYTDKEEQELYRQGKALLEKPDPTSTGIENFLGSLRDIINFADRKYYIEDSPMFSDEEYDKLFKLLKHTEERYPEHITTDSPTQRIALGLSEKFPAVSHLVPMLSLDNTYNAEDLFDWDKRCHDFAGEDHIEYCVEPKYDGASISLVYEKGIFERGATRGDGIMGEEITTNTRQIRSIPLSFKEPGLETIEIRGEVVIHKDVFAAYNAQRVADGLAPLANPRNAASGTLRILDPKEVGKRKLTAILYQVSYYNMATGQSLPTGFDTHHGTVQWLHKQGFPTPFNEMKLFNRIEDVITFCAGFETRRDNLPFEVDGLVIKVNNYAMQDKMGMTAHHPRWAVAYKFKARQATSTLLKVEFQVGRTGSVTPVAKITPTPIGGVTVTSISLFNEDVVREKDLHIGDTVLVERAGDVIPYIVKSMPELRTGNEEDIKFPTHCPVCGEQLEKPQDEAVWRCINISCPAQVVERIIHFASKDAMDIRNLGAANVQKFYDLGLLKNIPGIYNINWDEIRKLGGFGEKSINNLQTSIENTKQQPLNRVIYGLGIRHVGETTAKTLAHAVTHIRDIYDWNEEKLVSLEDIGPKVAASVSHFFHTSENRHMIDELEKAGVNLANLQTSNKQASGELAGKTFLFTGTLAKMKRSEAEAMAEEKGGSILSGVSTKLNYLIVGEDAGSKLEKAKKLGTVTIITEDEFLALIG